MTYYDIVNRVQEVVNDHEILQDFGYGALSDIKTVDEGTRVNYPYAFLNPTQSTRTGQTVTYRFNLIVMDVAQEDPTDGFANYLKVQSACQQYIDDILANLRFGKPYKDFDLTLNVNLTPFKERFQDTVAGMTATLEIEVPLALNDCIAPTPSELVIYSYTNGQVTEPDPTGQIISTATPSYDPQGLYDTHAYTAVFVNPQQPTTYRIEVEGTANGTESKPFSPAPRLSLQRVNTATNQPDGVIEAVEAGDTNWPTGVSDQTDFNWTATYEFNVPVQAADREVALLWSLRGDADPADETQVAFGPSTINIYEL